MKALAILAAVVAVLAIAYTYAFPRVDVRYELAFEVAVDGVVHKGSGVVQVSYRSLPQVLGASSSQSIEVVGEAVQVDLGSSGLLLALLERGQHKRSDPEALVPITFGVSPGGVGPEEYGRMKQLRGERDLPFDQLPLLVLLRDPMNSSSVVVVDPLRFSNAIPNGTLNRVTMRIVNSGIWPFGLFGAGEASVTRSVRARLPWLNDADQREKFARSLVAGGGPRNRSVENVMLFTRGD